MKNMSQPILFLLIQGLILKATLAILTPLSSSVPLVNSSMSEADRNFMVDINLPKYPVVLTVGQFCDPASEIRKCPEKTSCVKESDRLTDHKCFCDPNYTEATDGRFCIRIEGSACSFLPNECDTSSTFLFCMNSYCKCEPSDSYDPMTNKCQGRVGGVCYKGIKDCTANAQCVHNPHLHNNHKSNFLRRADTPLNHVRVNSDIEISGVCECQPGFVESGQGLCKKSYGRTCSSERECDELNLVCKEGICDCPDSLQTYDFQSQSCVALAGAPCSDYLMTGGTMCIGGAFCKRLNLKLSGRCKCLPDGMEMADRTCGRVSMWTPVN